MRGRGAGRKRPRHTVMRTPFLLAVAATLLAAKAQAHHALGGLFSSQAGPGAQKPLFDPGAGRGTPDVDVAPDPQKIPASCAACEVRALSLFPST